MTVRESKEYMARVFNDPIAEKLREFDLDPYAASDRKTLFAIIKMFRLRFRFRRKAPWVNGASPTSRFNS
jgi:hypothetical protein